MYSEYRQDIHPLDMSEGWEQVPGGAPGLQQKMLSNWLDETEKVGCRTRIIRFPPGQKVPDRFVHDYWEEVYILEGKLTIGTGEDGSVMGTFEPGSYACRPPGTPHGPFQTENGCTFFEIQYYSGYKPGKAVAE